MYRLKFAAFDNIKELMKISTRFVVEDFRRNEAVTVVK